MNETITLPKYIEKILSLASKHNNLKVYKSLCFRGHSDNSYKLLPSIARRIQKHKEETFLDYEGELVAIAKNRYPEIFRDEPYPLNLLAKLQHHGIPTRLLDVTENPLAALFFACSNNDDKDGEVIVFVNSYASEVPSSTSNMIADSYRFAYNIMGGFTYLDVFIQKSISQPYWEQYFADRYFSDTLDTFYEISCSKPIFVSALQLSSRQRAQQGKYILFPNEFGYLILQEDSDGNIIRVNKDDFFNNRKDIPLNFKDNAKGVFRNNINEIPKESKYIVSIIKIPYNSKKILLQQLASVGITKATLFPDSIDKGCEDIVERIKAWSI